jgi:flagellar basal-body rod modification protein FlgD
MHSVSANYTMPTVWNTLKAAPRMGTLNAPSSQLGTIRAASTSGGTTGTNGSNSSSSSDSGLGTTFLSLLAQELQNQDPTAPVDPTAMVGQMISLNQLEQLININQGITNATNPTHAAEQAGSTAQTAALLSPTSGAAILSPSAAGAASNQLPFDPNTMMPLNTGNPGAMAASINSPISAATMGISNLNNNTFGGK